MSAYIKQIQTLLKNAGFYAGAVDGIAGKMTVTAVEKAVAKGAITQDVARQVIVANESDPTIETVEPKSTVLSGYKLSQASLSRLQGVNPQLVAVVKRAIEITKQDFAVICGVRTRAEQARLVRIGASQTMNSRHLTGHAVDLVPVVNGKQEHADWKYYYAVADAMAQAARELKVNVRWGGCWEVINNKTGSSKSWVEAYGAARRAAGKKSFPDGPHFELPA